MRCLETKTNFRHDWSQLAMIEPLVACSAKCLKDSALSGWCSDFMLACLFVSPSLGET